MCSIIAETACHKQELKPVQFYKTLVFNDVLFKIYQYFYALLCKRIFFYWFTAINQFETNLSDWFPSVIISEETVSSSVLDTAMLTCTVDAQQNQTVSGFTSKALLYSWCYERHFSVLLLRQLKNSAIDISKYVFFLKA